MRMRAKIAAFLVIAGILTSLVVALAPSMSVGQTDPGDLTGDALAGALGLEPIFVDPAEELRPGLAPLDGCGPEFAVALIVEVDVNGKLYCVAGITDDPEEALDIARRLQMP